MKLLTFSLIKNKNFIKPNPHKLMKKFIYILLFAFVSALSFSACTEEAVTPSNELGMGDGGGGSIDPIKG